MKPRTSPSRRRRDLARPFAPTTILVAGALLLVAAGCGGESGPAAGDGGEGTIVIDVAPDAVEAPWTLAGPGDVHRSGSGDRTLADMAAGDYTVSWGHVNGWTAPADASRTLAADTTLTFDGEYRENPDAEAVVADHRAVQAFDRGDIPAHWIAEVKRQGILIHLPGRSHAQQLVGDLDGDPVRHVGGLKTLEQRQPTYAAAVACALADLPEGGALRVVKGQYHPDQARLIETWECRFDDHQYWSTATGREYTAFTAQHAAEAGDPLDASIFGWSYHIVKPDAVHGEDGDQITFDAERRQAYLEAIAGFDDLPPGTDFVYATAPIDGGYQPNDDYVGEDGLRATRHNQAIREAAIAAGGFLFDQADIENWNPDFTERRIETWEGHALRLRHAAWDGTDCAHGGMGLCVAKAKALWWLAARLAGWDGTPACRSAADCPDGECVDGVCR